MLIRPSFGAPIMPFFPAKTYLCDWGSVLLGDVNADALMTAVGRRIAHKRAKAHVFS